MSMNPKVIETWINNILKDAESIVLSTAFLKNDKRMPLNRYQIDRMTLTKGGIDNE